MSSSESGPEDEYVFRQETQQETEHEKTVEFGEEDFQLINHGPIKEHLMNFHQIEKKYGIMVNFENLEHSQTLSDEEIKKRQASFGLNRLTPPKELPEIVKFLLKFLDFFNIMLNIAAVISIISYAFDPSAGLLNVWLGLLLFAITVLISTISYITERQTRSIIKTISNMLPAVSQVLRNGAIIKIPAEELCLGDIVKLQTGSKIPADLRLIAVSRFDF